MCLGFSEALESVPCEKILERMEVKRRIKDGSEVLSGKKPVSNIERTTFDLVTSS